ncbi:Geranylgeranyl transferase type-2 subunit alpha [Hypsizygus marmoreus]|uniref:Geranylgeranyl transferase type-2 subunit alpha n=1 Tax=Hypsizygus marmoreus TaxID=39966 RepID=A0A369JFR3_HYPMA|nr:Geranylgeranyl transferase type-2 subunit alpha [Hypsizygus marmoreus]
MHGVKRVKQTPQALDAKKQRECAKLAEYLALTKDIISRKKSRDWSREALHLTSRLLQINPEFYTVWNYRRNIFLHGIFPNSTLEGINELLSDDLSTTMAALKAHPKVYWLWNHRRWCLENIPSGPISDDGSDSGGWKKSTWDRELFVVEKMLDADPRNFHAWDYRRYVLASMTTPRPKKSELAYTARKIEANISNFSAWHQRSKVITSLWDGNRIPLAKSRKEEFELLRNAMYTDPNDQSVWIYHRWLVGSGADKELLESEIAAIQELLDEQPDSKWCMESIVHYKRLLLRNHLEHVDTQKLSAECQELLEQLQRIDPWRRRRYEGIAQEMTG